MAANKGEWSEPYVALMLLGEGKLILADDDGKACRNKWLNVRDLVRYEGNGRTVYYEYISDELINISIDGDLVKTIPAERFRFYANKLKSEILNSSGSTFPVSNDIKVFLEEVEIKSSKAKSVNKSDIFISTEDPSTSIVRKNTGYSIKSLFGKDPTLFNTGVNSAAIYKLTNMNDEIMNEVNSMFDDKGHAAVSERCNTLLIYGCNFEFLGFPVAARAKCKTFEENLDLINPRLKEVLDFIMRTHFLTNSTARGVEEMVEIVINNNPCNISRGKEKYPYMVKSLLYASYCGLTAGTLWDGRSQVNGGFISVDGEGKITANLALESEGFKSYLYKHCYFEWPATSHNHGNYAYVYKENGEYYFRLNFQIRYR